MAVSLLSQEVADLCIGKPAVRTLPANATVGQALNALKSCEGVSALVVLDNRRKRTGKICMVDILCFLCAKENTSSPAAALREPVSVLVSEQKETTAVHRIEPDSSVWEALDLILEGEARGLLVPIYSKNKKSELACWLTQEDLVRFFFDSIYLFSPLASLSVTSLGLVRPDVLSVRHHEPATSALPLVRSALADHASVAVVTDDGKLIGEISPSTLSACDETVAAAVACLSAGELMAYVDCCSGGVLAGSVVAAVKSRLRENGMEGMIQLLEMDTTTSDVDYEETANSVKKMTTTTSTRKPRRTRSLGSYSARMGRRAEEAIVCHPESSLVAVMVQALAHRVSYVWVVREDDYGLVGIVTFQDVLRLLQEQLLHQPHL